jgi:hypothetical protein
LHRGCDRHALLRLGLSISRCARLNLSLTSMRNGTSSNLNKVAPRWSQSVDFHRSLIPSGSMCRHAALPEGTADVSCRTSIIGES